MARPLSQEVGAEAGAGLIGEPDSYARLCGQTDPWTMALCGLTLTVGFSLTPASESPQSWAGAQTEF